MASKSQVKSWMKRNVGSHVDRRTGEVNMTSLAEEAADQFDKKGLGEWLDDDTHWVWDAAEEVAGWYEKAHKHAKDKTALDWKGVAKKLHDRRKGKGQDDLHYRAYLKSVMNGQPSEHLVKKYTGAQEARLDLIDETGKAPKRAMVVAVRHLADQDKSAPQKVDEYFKSVKKDNPSYSDSQAWATAWSIYCKHKNPGSDHCKKDPDEYLKKQAGYGFDTGRMSVLFTETKKPFNRDTIREINRLTIPVVADDGNTYNEFLRVTGHVTKAPETRVDIEHPVDEGGNPNTSARMALVELVKYGRRNGFRVAPTRAGYRPR